MDGHHVDEAANLTYQPADAVQGVRTIRLQLVERPQLTGRDYLQLLELQVFDESGSNNIANQAVTTASSSSWSAGLAVDGSLASSYSSSNQVDAWLELRFSGSGVTVSRVEIVPVSGLEFRLYPSLLTVTTDGSGRCPSISCRLPLCSVLRDACATRCATGVLLLTLAPDLGQGCRRGDAYTCVECWDQTAVATGSDHSCRCPYGSYDTDPGITSPEQSCESESSIRCSSSAHLVVVTVLGEGCKIGTASRCSRCWDSNGLPRANNNSCACKLGYRDDNSATGNLDLNCSGECPLIRRIVLTFFGAAILLGEGCAAGTPSQCTQCYDPNAEPVGADCRCVGSYDLRTFGSNGGLQCSGM